MPLVDQETLSQWRLLHGCNGPFMISWAAESNCVKYGVERIQNNIISKDHWRKNPTVNKMIRLDRLFGVLIDEPLPAVLNRFWV